MGTFMQRVLIYGEEKLAAGHSPTDHGTMEPSPEQTYLYNNSIAWIVFLPFVTFENVICLLAIASRRKWKSPDVLFFSIVFNNLLTLLLPVTIYTVIIFIGADWSQNLAACKFVVWCVISFRVVNVLQLAFLSLDRVWTLKWPGSYTVHNTANQNARTAGLMWLFGMSIGTVPMIGWEDPIVPECSLVLTAAGKGYTLCVVILLVGSSSISVSCVVTMVIKLKYGDDIFASTGSKHEIPEIVVENETGQRQMNPHESRDRQNRQVCTIVGWVVIVDVLINELPFTVFNFIALNETGAWLQVTNTWCNIIFCGCVPLMLCTISRRYRLGLLRVVRFLQVALGCAEPPQERDQPAINRQETVDSLDCYRPDDQDEPINFPEPLSQEVISFDDSSRDVESADDSEPFPTDGPRVLHSRNTRKVHAETHVTEGYDDDGTEARPERAGMTSQEKRAHYQALGARRKKLLDAREKHRESETQSNRKNKERKKQGRETVNYSPSKEGTFLRVESAKRKAPARNLAPAASGVRQSRALSTNRIKIPTDNVTILKAFSADDDRLISEEKKGRLSRKVFNSVGGGVDNESYSSDPEELGRTSLGIAGSGGTDTEESLGGVEVTAGAPSVDAGTSGEANNTSGSGSNELYDIPEDPDEDLLSCDAGSERVNGPRPVNDRVESGRDKNFSDILLSQSDEYEDGVKSVWMGHFEDSETDGRSSMFSRPSDLKVPSLSVPLETLKSPNVFAHPELNMVLGYPSLKVPNNDVNNISRDTQMAGSPGSLSEPQKSKSNKKKGSKMNGIKPRKSKKEGKNVRIKPLRSNGGNTPQGDVFSFELQDIRRLSTELKSGGNVANGQNELNGRIKVGDVKKMEDDGEKSLVEKKVSAKDLRARFRETKTPRILARDIQKETDDVIFL